MKWNDAANWQRIYDFGVATTNYFFLTPRSSTGTMRFAITTNGNGAEQQINAPFALPTNSWCYVAVTLDGTKGVLYLNGSPVATNNNLMIRPWQTLAKTNYIGHSQFGSDPLFSGEISSFRIFGRALSGAEIKELASAPRVFIEPTSVAIADVNDDEKPDLISASPGPSAGAGGLKVLTNDGSNVFGLEDVLNVFALNSARKPVNFVVVVSQQKPMWLGAILKNQPRQLKTTFSF